MVGKAVVAVLLATLVGGCSNLSQREQRTLSGGAIGAASGLALTAVTGGSLLVGSVVGAAGGAAIGALTSGHH